MFLNGYDKNIINNKKAIAVLTINTANSFFIIPSLWVWQSLTFIQHLPNVRLHILFDRLKAFLTDNMFYLTGIFLCNLGRNT